MKSSDREVLTTAAQWLEEGHDVELITLVKAWGSSPRPVGAMAVVRQDGQLQGSVSGGCIEKQISTTLRKDDPSQVIQYKISSDQALRFGLTCGGTLQLVFEKLTDAAPLREIITQLDQRKRLSRSVNLENREVTISAADRNAEFKFDGKNLTKVFGPVWRLLLIGGGELSRRVADIALSLDYEVLVCEPRQQLHPHWQIPEVKFDDRSPDDVVKDYCNDSRSAVLALTHDPNLDDLAVMEALDSDVFYVGALGSTGNNTLRRKRLLALGLSQQQVDRLHGPVGLRIGSRTPAEIAVSIMAELTALKSGQSLQTIAGNE
ncbi:MAG: xanthine dehydrogenase accessory factor [Parasphingorhabdus sp.]|jgi:xanthine dehydrogenase accessory factor